MPHVPVEARFGHRLRAMRLARGVTQQQLADYLGIGRTHLSDIELGHKSPTLNIINVIAEGFKVSISTLMKGV